MNKCHMLSYSHDDVIKHFLHYWTFVRGIHRSPVNSLHKGQWRRSLMFSLICAWTNNWANNGDASNLRRHRAHYDVIVMVPYRSTPWRPFSSVLAPSTSNRENTVITLEYSGFSTRLLKLVIFKINLQKLNVILHQLGAATNIKS